MEKLDKILQQASQFIDDPTQGLPEEIFLFATEITPMVNVDLLIRDEKGQILLSWRDDKYYGKGWHVPGGILRLKEHFPERIQKTALNEIGCHVIYSDNPIEIVPIIENDMKTRGHFITFIYECKLPKNFIIDNSIRKVREAGYLEWHQRYPDDMLPVHSFYRKYFSDFN